MDSAVEGPSFVPPMLAVPGVMPPEREQHLWAYEMKWDGVRAVAVVRDGSIRLFGRSAREITPSYPELGALGAALTGRDAVLDGEMVAFDESGRVSFQALQPRIHGGARRGRRPIAYLVFDLLWFDGRWRIAEPYRRRRARLEELALGGPHWHTPPAFVGDGDAAVRTSRAQGLEGIVAKRLDAPYEPGRRSPAWTKVKNVAIQEVVIGGWRTGQDSRAATFGSLLCGVYDRDGRLAYVGRVGSGFGGELLRDLHRRLQGLARETSPFDSPTGAVPRADARDAHWVEPVLVGEVVFAGWTPDGRLWHPRWRGLRTDKDPHEVVREA